MQMKIELALRTIPLLFDLSKFFYRLYNFFQHCITRFVREIPAKKLLSAVVNTVRRMQCVIHKTGGHIECAR